jgi:hypothetical protein
LEIKLIKISILNELFLKMQQKFRCDMKNVTFSMVKVDFLLIA